MTAASRPIVTTTIHSDSSAAAAACTVGTRARRINGVRYIFYTRVSSPNYCPRAIVFHRLIFPVPDDKLKSLPYLSIYPSISIYLSLAQHPPRGPAAARLMVKYVQTFGPSGRTYDWAAARARRVAPRNIMRILYKTDLVKY